MPALGYRPIAELYKFRLRCVLGFSISEAQIDRTLTMEKLVTLEGRVDIKKANL